MLAALNSDGTGYRVQVNLAALISDGTWYRVQGTGEPPTGTLPYLQLYYTSAYTDSILMGEGRWRGGASWCKRATRSRASRRIVITEPSQSRCRAVTGAPEGGVWGGGAGWPLGKKQPTLEHIHIRLGCTRVMRIYHMICAEICAHVMYTRACIYTEGTEQTTPERMHVTYDVHVYKYMCIFELRVEVQNERAAGRSGPQLTVTTAVTCMCSPVRAA